MGQVILCKGERGEVILRDDDYGFSEQLGKAVGSWTCLVEKMGMARREGEQQRLNG